MSVVFRGCRTKTWYPSSRSSFWICCVSGGCAIPKPFRGPAEMQLFSHRDKVPELPQVHMKIISSTGMHLARQFVAQWNLPARVPQESVCLLFDFHC